MRVPIGTPMHDDCRVHAQVRAMKKWVFGAAAVLGAAVVALLLRVGALSGAPSRFSGACRSVPMAAGAGDLSADHARGVLYLAYLDRTRAGGSRDPTGTIMLVDLNATQPRVRAALNADPPGFRPIALSLYAPAEGMRRLFVIDAASGAASIQIFGQSATGAFVLVKTVRDPLLAAPTGIIAAGPEQFYATEDPASPEFRASGTLAQWWRLLVPSHDSTVVYYDGSQARTVASGLSSAAGITLSPNGRTLYVSERAARRVRLFARDAASGALREQKELTLPSLPERLHTDEAGNVWIAAHPHALAAIRSFGNDPARAPSQALELLPGTGGRIREMYGNTGAPLGGAAAATSDRDRLIVVSPSDPSLLLCERKP